jgi:hypothetical protein
MKVLYNNKIGKAVSLVPCDSTCSDCIFYPDNRDITICSDKGIMSVCVNFRMNICYKFLPDCSDLLNYEDETSTK